MKCLSALSLVVSVMGVTETYADWCDDISILNTQGDDATFALPITGDMAVCTQSLMLTGATQVHCRWAYAYRDPTASQAFDHLRRAVADCLGDAARVTEDPDVNHPDSYDLQTFWLGGQEVGVSLKDKAALAQTYLFLRVAPGR